MTAFADYDLRVARSKDGYSRAIGGREKFLYVTHSVSFDAKNRFGITEPLKFEPASIQLFLAASGSAPVLTSRSIREPPGGAAADAPRPGASAAVVANATPTAQPNEETKSSGDANATPVPNPEPTEATYTPDPDKEPDEIFLSDKERRAVEAILDSLPQDKLLKFLRERDLIPADADHHMLGPTCLHRILDKSEEFRNAVNAA